MKLILALMLASLTMASCGDLMAPSASKGVLVGPGGPTAAQSNGSTVSILD